MKRLWAELQRWNNSRTLTCDTCGPFAGRRRVGLVRYSVELHERAKPGHRVRVSRRG